MTRTTYHRLPASLALLSLLLVGFQSPAHAFSLTISASSDSRSASATFEGIGSDLKVTLTNTSSADALVPVDILTGVFFDLTGDPGLGRTSAVLGAGSSVLFPPSGDGTEGGSVGGEWAYNNALTGAPGGAKQGISSTGLGLFGPGDRFPGSNLQGPDSLDGLQYGITSAGDNPVTGNTPDPPAGVPEPGTLMLTALGAVMLVSRCRRRRLAALHRKTR